MIRAGVASPLRREGSHRDVVLVAVIAGLHAYSVWAFGATFWYDSANYLQLGLALGSPLDLREYYGGPNYYIYQHLMPGYPLLFATTLRVFGAYGWPVLTAIQHLAAIGALVYFLGGYRDWLPPRWRLVTGILICAHPFYMAFHAAPMTESLTGSLLLIAVGAALRILGGGPASRYTLPLLAGCGVVGVQIRSSVGMIVLGFLAVLFFVASPRAGRLRTTLAAVAVAASVLCFPAYRWIVTGAFFMPNLDYLTLALALGVNPHPSDDAVRKLEAFPLPSDLSAETIARRGLTYQQAANLGIHLRSLGHSDDAARTMVKRMAWIVRTDSPRVMVNQARLALLSVGSSRLALVGADTRELYRGLGEFRHHVQYYLRWFSWTRFDTYAPVFDRFFAMFGQTPETIDEGVRQSLKSFLTPFFVKRKPAVRDPLRLLTIPFDVWLAASLLAVLSLSRRRGAIGVLCVTPVLLSYLVSLSAPIGDLRYSQGLLPLYLAGTVVFLAQATAWCRSLILAAHA